METDAVVDAAEFLLAELTDRDEVAHAEVGGVAADCSDAVITDDGVRSTTSFTTTGVWWRLFAEGSADYRFSTSLEEEHLQEIIDRSIRSATLLGQEQPARFDPETVHRATHPGWGDGSLGAQSVDEASDEIDDGLDAALDGLETDRARVEYKTRAEEAVMLTTTGTTLRATLERASARGTIVPAAGGKVSDHYGETTGARFLERVPDYLDSLAERAHRIATSDPSSAPEGRQPLVFAPEAAAALVAAFSAYLELDTAYMGSSPFDLGDRFGPDQLTVEDSVRPGSWAARAFDAEGRPTQATTLVDDGVVNTFLTDTSGAAEEGTHPSGTVIPSLGWEEPPRIHARHLDVFGGTATEGQLRTDAAVAIERVGPPEFVNEATRTKRASGMPPSTLYADDVGSQTPAEFDDEAANQRIRFPIREAYLLDAGERTARLPEASVVVTPADVRSLEAMSTNRETATGTHEKHGSTIPWAVTAPAMLVSAHLTGR